MLGAEGKVGTELVGRELAGGSLSVRKALSDICDTPLWLGYRRTWGPTEVLGASTYRSCGARDPSGEAV